MRLDLGEGYHTYARELQHPFVAIYDARTIEPMEPGQIVARPPLFIVGVFDQAFNRWKERLRHLIAYAEIWGIADDLIREDFIRHSPAEALKRLAKTVAPFDDVLDEWLGGPEADNPNPTAESIAFSAMRMVTDSL